MKLSVRPLMTASLLLFVLAACQSEEPQGAPPPPEVGVVVATPRSVPLEREMVGRLAPFRSSDVRARVPGVLLQRSYEEGSDVREGQVLFRIDPAPLQASLSSSQAQLAAAQATHANARVAADRARELAPQQFVSRSDLDNAEAAERTASASVQQARAAVTSARISLGYASVTAPISGRAGQQQVTEGALVGQGDATLLTTIDQLDPLYVNFSMGADELDELQRAQGGGVALQGAGQARVQVLLGDGRIHGEPGVLDFSGAVVDPQTGAVSLRATLPNPGKRLLPGSFVTLRTTLGTRSNAYLVPQAAVQRDPQGAYVMVVGANDLVARKNIETAGTQEGSWVVTSGLAPGDRIIVAGLQRVREETPVTTVPWSPPAAAAGVPTGAGTAAGPPADAAGVAPQAQN